MTDMNVKVEFTGMFKLVLNEGTDRETSTGWFPNLITDGGLDRLGNTGAGIIANGSVGTGTTTPAFTDTSLSAYTAQTTTNLVSSSPGTSPNYIAQMTINYIFAQGAVVANLAEVGIGWGTTGTGLWSHALILDSFGVPTTLTVTSFDQLTIFYQVACNPVLTDLTAATVVISPTTYTYTGRIGLCASFLQNLYYMLQSPASVSASSWGIASNISSYAAGATIGAITGNPSGASTSGSNGSTGYTFTSATYVNGNKYRDSTIVLAPSVGNLTGGTQAIMIGWGSPVFYQYVFTAAIPKDNTKTLTFVVRYYWDRV